MPVISAATADDPEKAHSLAILMLSSGIAPKDRGVDDERLSLEVISLLSRARRTTLTRRDSSGDITSRIPSEWRLDSTSMLKLSTDYSISDLVTLKWDL